MSYTSDLLNDENERKKIASLVANQMLTKSGAAQAGQMTNDYIKYYNEAMRKMDEIKRTNDLIR